MGSHIRKRARLLVSAEYARQILAYDKQTGDFTWKVRTGRRAKIGAKATVIQKGRNTVTLMGTRFQASNVAWLYVYGEWPNFEVDHRDQNKFNDAIDNLRPSNTSKNMMNRGKTKANKTGFKGVCKQRNGFVAWIGIDYVNYYLGKYPTAELAGEAYRRAANLIHGEFAGV